MTNDEINQCAVLVARAMEQNLIDNGWRRCAIGQRSTQFCSQLEAAVNEAVAKAIAAEREACADICDHLMDTAVTKEMAIAYGNAADAIRGRG